MPERNKALPAAPSACATTELAYSIVPLAELDNPVLLQGLDYWRGLRGARNFPSRTEVTPRGLLGLLRNTKLLRVVDGGKDFQCRIVGDAYVMAHGYSFQGKNLSEDHEIAPGYAAAVTAIYKRVVGTAEPVAFRGWVGRSSRSVEQIYSEGVALPLGADGAIVDHILVFSVFVPRDRFGREA